MLDIEILRKKDKEKRKKVSPLRNRRSAYGLRLFVRLFKGVWSWMKIKKPTAIARSPKCL
jgi:hypothetical protein